MIIHGDVAFMIVSTVLVLIMTPGLAIFYGGLVERKNSLTIMYQSFISLGIVTILWIFCGFSLVFGTDIGGVIGNPLDYFLFNDITFFTNLKYGPDIPFIMFFMYQLMFAIITAPLMTGAYANRLNMMGWIKIVILWMILVYFPVAHWVWGGGFLAKLGFVVIGAAILLFGWFGFNAGGSLAAAETAAIVFTNTAMAASSSMIVWTILYYIKNKTFSFLELIVGTVAGLATVTPASGYITPISAFVIGAIAGLVCFYCVEFEHKWKRLDDALDVWGVHGMGGFIGTLCIGIFANPIVNRITPGIDQFLIQLMGSVLVIVYSIIVTYIVFWISDKIGSIFVSPEIQQSGLDKAFFGESFSDYE